MNCYYIVGRHVAGLVYGVRSAPTTSPLAVYAFSKFSYFQPEAPAALDAAAQTAFALSVSKLLIFINYHGR